jgi:hypothetical protein
MKFATRTMARTAEMITALTSQVLPRTTDALLTFWTSRSRKAAPRKKKCQWVRSQLATRSRVRVRPMPRSKSKKSKPASR